MKLCVPMPCFFGGKDFVESIYTVKELGFDTIETYFWTELDLDAVKKALDETGVNLMSMCTTNFTMNDPLLHDKWLDGLKETCKAADKLGVKKLITQVGQDNGKPRDEQHKAIVDCLKKATDILNEHDIILMIEPLNLYVDHPGYYLWSAVEGFEMIKEVNHPKVKLVYDIYHQQVMEGNIIPNITANLDLIAHIHGAGHPGRIDLQYGENNYNFIFQKIEEAGYNGYCGLEYSPVGDPIESLKKAKELFE